MAVIVNIEKPKDCMECMFRDDHDDCMLIKNSHLIKDFGEQYKLCPLREYVEDEDDLR